MKREMKVRFVCILTLAGALACGLSASEKQSITTTGEQIAACVLAQIFAGNTDPGSIAASCYNIAVSDVENVIANFMAQSAAATTPDAGAEASAPTAAKSARIQLPADFYNRLALVRAAAHVAAVAGR
jgi:hypothetical protein